MFHHFACDTPGLEAFVHGSFKECVQVALPALSRVQGCLRTPKY